MQVEKKKKLFIVAMCRNVRGHFQKIKTGKYMRQLVVRVFVTQTNYIFYFGHVGV